MIVRRKFDVQHLGRFFVVHWLDCRQSTRRVIAAHHPMSLAELLCLARATAKNLNSVGWGDFKDADSPICVESKQVRAIIWCSVENLHWFSMHI
jgi:hypothetical protein